MTTAENRAALPKPPPTMDLVRRFLAAAPGTLLTATDIPGATPGAASKALSRLAKQGLIRRVRKGLYYIPKQTLLGTSQPSEADLIHRKLGSRARPTGLTAANVLGFTTQVAAQLELAAYATARPRGMDGLRLRLHLRPRGRTTELPPLDGALLEFLRDRGGHSELAPEKTWARARKILLEGESSPLSEGSLRLRQLRDAALLEPPRVRAILGALMQSAGLPESLWGPLRDSLNRLSRFDFGVFRDMPNAREWQAR